MLEEINLNTSRKNELVEITSAIQKAIAKNKIKEGFCQAFVPHTTAGITINENADPSVKKDILVKLDELVPAEDMYSHTEGNAPAHIKSSLMGHSLTLLIRDGRLVLGTWQGVFLAEFDGPRQRKVLLRFFTN